jgi:hypothetical protein
MSRGNTSTSAHHVDPGQWSQSTPSVTTTTTTTVPSSSHQPPRILQQQRRTLLSTNASSSSSVPLQHQQTRSNLVFPIAQQQLNMYSPSLSTSQQQQQQQQQMQLAQQPAAGVFLAMQLQQQQLQQQQQQQQHQQQRLSGSGSPLGQKRTSTSGGGGGGEQQQLLTPHQLHHLQQQQAAAAAQGRLIVVDPMRPKLRVPLSAIQNTRALTRSGANPSLCMLFLHGKCRQEGNCHQVHADPATIHALREEAASQPTCCQEHGDSNDCLRPSEWPRNLVFQIQQVAVPLHSVAYTAGLKRFVDEAVAQHQYHQHLLHGGQSQSPPHLLTADVKSAAAAAGQGDNGVEMLSTTTTASTAMITVGGKPLPAAASTSTMGETPGMTNVASRLSVVSDVPLAVVGGMSSSLSAAASYGGVGALAGTPPKTNAATLVGGADSADGNSPSINSCGSTQQTSPQTLTGGGGVEKWALAVSAGSHSYDSSLAPNVLASATSPPMSGNADDLDDDAKFISSLSALEALKQLGGNGIKAPVAAIHGNIEHSLAVTSVCQLHFGAGDDQASPTNTSAATGGRAKHPAGCRYGEDCKFLHVCRHIIRSELGAIMPQAVPPTSSASPHLSHHSGSSSPINAAASNRSQHTTAAPSPSFGFPAGAAPLGSSTSASPIPRAPSGISAHTSSSLNASPVHFPTSAYHSPQTTFQAPGMIVQQQQQQQQHPPYGGQLLQYTYEQGVLQHPHQQQPQQQQQQQPQTVFVQQTDSEGNISYVPCIIVNNNNNNNINGAGGAGGGGQGHQVFMGAGSSRPHQSHQSTVLSQSSQSTTPVSLQEASGLSGAPTTTASSPQLWSAASHPPHQQNTSSSSLPTPYGSPFQRGMPQPAGSSGQQQAHATAHYQHHNNNNNNNNNIHSHQFRPHQVLSGNSSASSPHLMNVGTPGSLNSEIPYSPALSSHGAQSPHIYANSINRGAAPQHQPHVQYHPQQVYQQQYHLQQQLQQPLAQPALPPQQPQQIPATGGGTTAMTTANIQLQQQLQLNGGSFAMASNNGSMAFSTASSFALPPPADARSATSAGISCDVNSSNSNAAAAAAAYFLMQQQNNNNTSLVGLSGSMVRPLSHTSSACASPPTASPRGGRTTTSLLPPLATSAAASIAGGQQQQQQQQQQLQLPTSTSSPSLVEDEMYRGFVEALLEDE